MQVSSVRGRQIRIIIVVDTLYVLFQAILKDSGVQPAGWVEKQVLGWDPPTLENPPPPPGGGVTEVSSEHLWAGPPTWGGVGGGGLASWLL